MSDQKVNHYLKKTHQNPMFNTFLFIINCIIYIKPDTKDEMKSL